MVPKLLLLAFILLVAWYGVRFVTRVGQMRQAMRRATEQAAMNAQARGQGARPAIAAEDLVKCRTCGAFVPAKSATSCGRADCPY
jgi:uncharacterized protein